MTHVPTSSDNLISSSTDSPTSGDAPKWLVYLAKAGYAARGVIYLIIGGMALLQAFGKGGEKTDSKGALGQLLEAPFGIFLLWLMALGLVGYAIWRFVQASMDPDNHGTETKGIAIRSGLFVSAITHSILAVYAASLAMQQNSSGSGSSSTSWVGKIMSWPAGQFIVGLIGVAIIGAAIAHGIKAGKEKYRDFLDTDPQKMEKLNPICKFGLYARGVAFAIIGGFFIMAAVTQNPEKAGGIEQVIQTISQQTYGTILLALMGGGLLAFGIYSIIESVYRRIDAPN